ncbi:MAG: SHOCT domain-containing protein [Actinomycetota bacterium]|nr:SHOCT domain-containing protein [Actinomycetota bacterium]
MMYGGSGWAMAAMSLFWLVVLGLVVWLTATATGSRAVPTPSPDPRWILQDRFARGDIDREEYRDRLAALDGR